ncbi:MAG: tRNA lysidine(34) synthetase TilS [Bacillota bacterium]
MEISFDKKLNIGVAVSGGADSMVLLTLLKEQGARVVAINIDHSIRGAESVADSAFVADYCNKKNIPILGYTVDAIDEAKKRGLSTETVARQLRYDIFDNLLADNKVDVIALAHHASDQTETIIMRLMRGTGVRGLRGIVDRAGYIHPLLSYNKKQILNYAESHNIPYVTDSTNSENLYTRNYIRNEVVPILEARFPSIDQAIARLTATMSETEDYLLSEVTKCVVKGDRVELPLRALDRHIAIAKKSIVQCFVALGIHADIEYSLLNSILQLRTACTNSTIDATHDIVVIKGYNELIFTKKSACNNYLVPFDISAQYSFCGQHFAFSSTTKIVAGASFDMDKIPSSAVIRTRLDGDKFKRYGGGNKSLSDYLTDIKMPYLDRQNVLVLANNSDILAVLGTEISDIIKIDKNTTNKYKIISL